MQTQDLKPGDKFHFAGDWQTEPGNWKVTAIDPEAGIECESIDGKNGKSFFHRNVTVNDPR